MTNAPALHRSAGAFSSVPFVFDPERFKHRPFAVFAGGFIPRGG